MISHIAGICHEPSRLFPRFAAGCLLFLGITGAVRAQAQSSIILAKTVYEGANGGAGCAGAGEIARGNLGDPITFCFTVRNTGATRLDGVNVEDPDLSLVQSIGTLLPGASASFFVETNIVADVTNTATASGISNPGAELVQDTDQARVDRLVECPSDCFVISDVGNSFGPDNLYRFNVLSGQSELVGAIRPEPYDGSTGVDANCLEATTFALPSLSQPVPLLYSIDAGRTCVNGPNGPGLEGPLPFLANEGYLGTIDYANPVITNGTTNVTWRPLPLPIGVGSNVNYRGGIAIAINDVDAMDFDPTGVPGFPAGTLFIAVRQDAEEDLLAVVDASTGALVKNAFGPGQDFVPFPTLTVLETNEVSGAVVTHILNDVDDFAISKRTTQMWGIANDDGTFDYLVEIDRTTGQFLRNFPIVDEFGNRFQDMEGLSFDPIAGVLYATSGFEGTPADSLFQISLTAGTEGLATNLGAIPGTGDYEGSDCFLVEPDAISTISGTVFWDASEDGTYDTGTESPLADALVTLWIDLNSNGVLEVDQDFEFLAEITDANGQYQFLVPIDQNYLLQIAEPTLPPGYCSVTTRSVTSIYIPNACGLNEVAPDFGVTSCRAIGNFVWDDLNEDGIQQGTEPGIPGVVVNLRDSNGLLLTNTVTDASGAYLFRNLASSNFVVEVITPSGYAYSVQDAGMDDEVDSDVDSVTGRTGLVDVTGAPPVGQFVVTNNTVDAALFLPTDVAITKASGDAVASAGDVTFDYILTVTNTGLRALTGISVSDALPAGLDYEGDNAGGSYDAGTRVWSAVLPSLAVGASTNVILSVSVTNATAQAVVNTACVAIGFPETSLANNCGTNRLAVIGDFVWQDSNRNGIQDAAELSSGIAGVTVRLLNGQGTVVGSTVSAANGSYFFAVPAGSYEVEFVAPSGTTFTSLDAGMDDSVDSDALPATGRTGLFAVAEGEVNDDVDAGLLVPLDVSKTTSAPLASNGPLTFDYVITVENESAVAADPVRIEDTLPVWASYVSDDAGGTFASGVYSVDVGPLGAGATRIVNVRVQVLDAALASSLVNTAIVNNAFFATHTSSRIGDLVFLDNDHDGVQSPGDTGIPNAPVQLLDAAGTTVLAVTNTSATGQYAFVVPGGTYRVRYFTEPGTEFVPANIGSEALDSDANPADGVTDAVILAAGETNNDVDGGLVNLAAGVTLEKTVASGANQPCPGVEQVTVLSGQDLTYCFTVTNTGLTYLAETLLTDADITPALSQSLGILAPGQSVTVAVNSVSSTDLINRGIVVGVPSRVDGTPLVGRPPVTATNTASVDVIGPAIEIRKSVYAGNSGVAGCEGVNFLAVTNGQTVTYCFLVTNTGDSRLDDVSITDTNLTPSVTISVGTLAAGQSFTGAVAQVAVADLLNVATATGTAPSVPPTVVRDTDDAEVDVINPGIEITKTVYLGANGGVSCPGVESVSGTNGTAITYCFLIRNTGDAPLANVTVSDSDITPAFSTLVGSLPVGGVITAFVENVVSGDLVNVATATGFPPVGPPVDDDDDATVREIPTSIIGDLVWDDLDGDGLQDQGEPGIPAVTVYLLNSSGVVIRTTTTDPSGQYTFTGVVPGTYAISYDPNSLPAGYVPTPNVAGQDTLNSDPLVATRVSPPFVVGGGVPNFDQDIGFYLPIVLGDRVWRDANDNGIQDPGETGIPGIRVFLFDANTNTQLSSVLSDATGSYRFTGLVPGSYYLQFDLSTVPAGFVVATPGQGAGNVDSDGDVTTGLTPPTGFLNSGATNNDLDLGLVPLGRIGDTVWYDVNGNGVPDENIGPFNQGSVVNPGLGIPGVTVNLYRMAGNVPTLVSSTVTVATATNRGFYEFQNLRPAVYRVEVDNTTVPAFLRGTRTAPQLNAYHEFNLAVQPLVSTADFGFNARPNAVHLVGFTAEADGGVVRLAWTTGSETNNLGFNLYRSAKPDGTRIKVNGALVEASGSGAGADYAYIDAAVTAGTWYYWLEDVEFKGKRTSHGPVRVDFEGLENREFTLEASGLHQITAGAGAATLEVQVDGAATPALATADGSLVFVVPDGAATVKLVAVEAPVRMAVREAAPLGGETVVVISEDGAQAAFTSIEAVQSYLAIGFAGGDLIVIDETDPAAPVALSGVEVIQTSGDAGAYFSTDEAGGDAIRVRRKADIPVLR